MLKPRVTSTLTLLALTLTACGTAGSERSAPADGPGEVDRPTKVESAGPQPRLAVTYDGGAMVLDAASGEVLLDAPFEGYARVSPAGDGRHVFVAAAGAFTAVDLGSWTDAHGDHGHSFTTPPRVTDVEIAAEEPGHVVPHDGRTTLFDDGTGTITTFATDDLAELDPGQQPDLTVRESAEAHHGVAVVDGDGTLLQTVGDADSRSGVRLSTAAGAELAASDECPGVHGEAAARDALVVGCEDGVLVVTGRELTKVSSPDAYGRIGNQAGSETSPYVLGDYKTDADAELERPTRVTLVDTRDGSLELVDLGTSYSFRSLGRGPGGEGIVLGTDGALHVLDPERARVTGRVPVVAPWREPLDWHQPRPTLAVAGGTAYVTEPSRQLVHVVDLATEQVTATHRLPVVPDELSATAG